MEEAACRPGKATTHFGLTIAERMIPMAFKRLPRGGTIKAVNPILMGAKIFVIPMARRQFDRKSIVASERAHSGSQSQLCDFSGDAEGAAGGGEGGTPKKVFIRSNIFFTSF